MSVRHGLRVSRLVRRPGSPACCGPVAVARGAGCRLGVKYGTSAWSLKVFRGRSSRSHLVTASSRYEVTRVLTACRPSRHTAALHAQLCDGRRRGYQTLGHMHVLRLFSEELQAEAWPALQDAILPQARGPVATSAVAVCTPATGRARRSMRAWRPGAGSSAACSFARSLIAKCSARAAVQSARARKGSCEQARERLLYEVWGLEQVPM